MASVHGFRRAVSMDRICNTTIEGEQKTLHLLEKIVKSAPWVAPDSLCTCTVSFKLFPFLWNGLEVALHPVTGALRVL